MQELMWPHGSAGHSRMDLIDREYTISNLSLHLLPLELPLDSVQCTWLQSVGKSKCVAMSKHVYYYTQAGRKRSLLSPLRQ